MKNISCAIMICGACLLDQVWAFNAAIYYNCLVNEPLADQCNGGAPLQDGTIAEIFWDRNENGPDAEDDLVPVGDGWDLANYSTFTLNGELYLECPGGFYTDPLFTFAHNDPVPNRFWVRVCIPGTMTAWVSNIIVIGSGFSEHSLTFNCIENFCTGCVSPVAVTGAVGSMDRCDGVSLSWDRHLGPDVVAVRVTRNQAQLADVPVVDTTYLDTTAPAGLANVPYFLQAVRVCEAGDTSLSPWQQAYGFRLSPPLPPRGDTVQVLNPLSFCGAVIVRWRVPNSIVGIDSFVVYQNEVEVGRASRGTPGQAQSDTIYTSLTGPQQYSVATWSAACGYSDTTASRSGTALFVPPAPSGLQAPADTCELRLTWDPVSFATSYKVYRDNVLIATVNPPSTTFVDQSVVPLFDYFYEVSAVISSNPLSCREGAKSGVLSNLLGTPISPVMGAASDSAYCTHVSIAWIDNGFSTSNFLVRRDGVTIASTPYNVTTYNDSMGLPGVQYLYSVAASNQCGASPPSVSNAGSRKTVPAQVGGVVASENLCDAVQIEWSDVSSETGYSITRDGSTIGTVGAGVLQFIDSSALSAHSYTVLAQNECGPGIESIADSGRFGTAPSINMLLANSACDRITLTFAATTNTDSLRIYRDTALIATLAGSNGEYEDIPPTAGDYEYTAEAMASCGVSALFGPVSGTALMMPEGPHNLSAANDGCAMVVLSWTPASGSFGFYEIARDGQLLQILSNDAAMFADPNAVGGIEYVYSVVAVNDTCGASVTFDSVTAEITLSALPAAPEIVITVENRDAVLQWSGIDTTVVGCPIEATRYLVYFSELSDGPFFYHGSTTDTSYRHVEVVRFAQDMYYVVETFVGDVELLQAVPEGGVMLKDDVKRRLRTER